ncbi:MAG: hypothetical protein L3J97_06585, partial [Thermoplasmata archaeon]|nr:hypothetical protein [Thermoplasmata archaeon]
MRAALRPRTRYQLAAIAACAVLLGATGASWDRSFGPTVLHAVSTKASGSQQLAAAQLTLERGAGPAAGHRLQCSATGVSAGCSLASVSPFPASATWTNLSSRAIPAPGPRITQMVWDAADSYVLLFGGEFITPSHRFGINHDTWTYANGVWTNISTMISGGPPPAGVAPGMAYDPWAHEVVLFGGSNGTKYQSQTWTYVAKTWN